MGQQKPMVDILQHVNTGTFLLMHYAMEDKLGWTVGWGTPSKYSPGEFETSGLDAVLHSLREFGSRDGNDESKLFLTTDVKEQARFTREHLSLSLRLESPDLLIVTPNRRERGGYTGRDRIRIELPISPKDFFDKIEDAFEMCS